MRAGASARHADDAREEGPPAALLHRGTRAPLPPALATPRPGWQPLRPVAPRDSPRSGTHRCPPAWRGPSPCRTATLVLDVRARRAGRLAARWAGCEVPGGDGVYAHAQLVPTSPARRTPGAGWVLPLGQAMARAAGGARPRPSPRASSALFLPLPSSLFCLMSPPASLLTRTLSQQLGGWDGAGGPPQTRTSCTLPLHLHLSCVCSVSGFVVLRAWKRRRRHTPGGVTPVCAPTLFPKA